MAIFGGGPSDKVLKQRALERVVERTWTDAEGRRKCLQELNKYAKELRPIELVPLLGSPDGSVRTFAETILRGIDARGVEIILRSLGTQQPRARDAVMHSLVRNKSEFVLQPLQEMVLGQDRDLSVRAMEALSALPPTRVGAGFLKFLEHERREIRAMALVKVSESETLLKDPAIRRTIYGLMGDEEERIRLRALETIARIDPQEGIRFSLTAIRDPAVAVQQRAVALLGGLLEEKAAADAEEAENQLLNLLSDASEGVRNGVLDIVMRRKDRERVIRKLLLFSKNLLGWARDRTLNSLRNYAGEIRETIIRLMHDEDEDVRAMALMAGATLEDPATVPHVIGMLSDEDWWIRMIAAETLGNIGDAAAVPELVRLLEDPDTSLAAIEALGRIGDPSALRPLVDLYKRSDTAVRAEVVEHLRHFDAARVVPVLDQVIEKDPADEVRRVARDVRAAVGGRAVTDADAFRMTEQIARRMETMKPIERLLVRAREIGGSDLHLIVGSPPMVRVDGHFRPLEGEPYTPASVRETIYDILSDRDRGIVETKTQVDLTHAIPDVGRYRFNVYVDRRGLAAAARVIPNRVPTIADIGLPPHIGDLVNHSQGLVIVSGASGAGKSTTLAALVNLFNERLHSHILVFEDPIEFVHPPKGCLVNQRSIGVHSRSFPSALRGALREDPDIIVVGEMRDAETVRLAIEASETGHLVIATMNTPSAPKSVDRVIDAFPVNEQTQVRTMLSDTLKCVVAQRLLPRADGKGRVACFEVLMGTLGVRNLIREEKTYQLISSMQVGEPQGHVTVDRALQRLLESNLITPETAWLHAQAKDVFEGRVSPEFLAGQSAIGQ